MGQGVGQLIFYAAVLIALSYPLGIWMAHVYTRERGDVVERAFLRLLGEGRERRPEALEAVRGDRSSSSRSPSAPSSTCSCACRATCPSTPTTSRRAGRLDEHDGELRHEHELAVLRRRVHDVVPDADGGARRAELRLGSGRHGGPGGGDPRLRAARRRKLGNFWVDLYRSIVYILLPLSIVLAVVLISQGVPRRSTGTRRPRRSRARTRRSRAARPRRRSRSSSSARTAAASTTRTPPSRSRTRTGSRTSSRCSRSCSSRRRRCSCSARWSGEPAGLVLRGLLGSS